MDESEYNPPDTSLFVPCSICGRTFNPEVLARHQNVCQKVKQGDQRRKPFDMSRKRAEGTDLEKFMKENLLYNNSDSPKQPPKKKANWRSKHSQFVNSIRSARVVTKAILTGAPLPPHEPSAPDPDYVQCPYCERRFQEYAAERHIPFCKEKAARLPPPSKAKETPNKRVAYKPPAITRRRSGAVQDSSANPPGFSVVKKNSNFSSNLVQPDQEEEEEAPPTGSRKAPGPFRPAKPLTRPVQGQPKTSHIPISSSGTITKKTTAFSMGPNKDDSDELGDQPTSDLPKVAQSMTSRKLYAALEYSEGNGEEAESPPIKGVRSAPDQTCTINKRSPSPASGSDVSMRSKPRSRRLSHLNNNGSSDDHQPRDISAGSLGGTSASRHVPLNEHGMPMSKFCYECGTKYPVPQAKYCSECGTKRL